MKLIDYARKMGVSYKTAWLWYKSGKLQGKQMGAGTILVFEEHEQEASRPEKVAMYAHASSARIGASP